MIIAIDASTVEAMLPKAGTPLGDSRLNWLGNRPSFAAASGISAQIIVQPVSAPNPEMITAMAMTSRAHVPPNIEFAASENGAVDVASSVVDRTPNITVSDTMYTTAVARVPRIVALGTLRSGSFTFAAATAAHSTPR